MLAGRGLFKPCFVDLLRCRSEQAHAGRERAAQGLVTLLRLEWGADNSAIRQLFATRLMPCASREQVESFNDLQRKTTSGECAAVRSSIKDK